MIVTPRLVVTSAMILQPSLSNVLGFRLYVYKPLILMQKREQFSSGVLGT